MKTCPLCLSYPMGDARLCAAPLRLYAARYSDMVARSTPCSAALLMVLHGVMLTQ